MRFSPVKDELTENQEERYRLGMPMRDAIAFALGWDDLGYPDPKEDMRQIIGYLAVDALEYDEQWRMSSLLQSCLRIRWQELDDE